MNEYLFEFKNRKEDAKIKVDRPVQQALGNRKGSERVVLSLFLSDGVECLSGQTPAEVR